MPSVFWMRLRTRSPTLKEVSITLVMTSLSHDGGESFFFVAVGFDASCLLDLSFL
jgi:hypothetical protein